MTDLVFLDTETTSLDPTTRLAWEIGAIKQADDGTETTLHLIVGDIDLSHADERALGMNGFYDRHPSYHYDPLQHSFRQPPKEGQVTVVPERVAMQAVEWFTRGAVILGTNPGFDMTTLDRQMRKHRLIPAWHYRPVDVGALLFGAMLNPPALPWKSREVAEFFGIEPDPDWHAALADARYAQRMYHAWLSNLSTSLT